MQNYPYFNLVSSWKDIILSFWITSEMVMTLTRDPLCLAMIEEGTRKAEFKETMESAPEGF